MTLTKEDNHMKSLKLQPLNFLKFDKTNETSLQIYVSHRCAMMLAIACEWSIINNYGSKWDEKPSMLV